MDKDDQVSDLGKCPWGRASLGNGSPLGTSSLTTVSLAWEAAPCSCLSGVMHLNTYIIYVYMHAYKSVFIYVDPYNIFIVLLLDY